MKGTFYYFLLIIMIMVAAAGCGGRVPEAGEALGQTLRTTPEPVATTAAPATILPTQMVVPDKTGTPTAPVLLTPTVSPTAMPSSETEGQPERQRPTPPSGPLSGAPLVAALRSGGYVIYFRHAATDPTPDDAQPVDFSDCRTQRNLSEEGRTQARAMGEAIQALGIPTGRVLASPFCRTLETARLAFREATSEPGLENLETAENEAERERRIGALQSLLAARPEEGANTILVGHGFNINAAAGITIAEGEAAIFRPEGEGGFTLVARIKPGEWEDL